MNHTNLNYVVHPVSRKLRVYYRELKIRLKGFRMFILTFVAASLFGSIVLSNEFNLSTTRALYEAITLMFFASTLDFPEGNTFLEIMWILYPTFGLILLADGLSGIGLALRLGDKTSKEWNQEMAKLMENHVIVIGIGNLGLRIINQILNLEMEMVVIDLFENPSKEDLMEEYQVHHEIPVVKGDASMDHILHEASIAKAKALMVLIDDDLLNLKIAIKARKINPELDIILRFFDIEFGNEISKLLNFDMLSTSKIAVDQFIAKID